MSDISKVLQRADILTLLGDISASEWWGLGEKNEHPLPWPRGQFSYRSLQLWDIEFDYCYNENT